MNRRMRICCTWSVVFFFLFTLFSPDDALCFDEDTLVTAAIVSGITLGVALLVVLVAGTLRDVKGDKDEEDEDDDVWTQSPVLRTLGYRYMDDPLFGRTLDRQEGLEGRRQIEAFLAGKTDRILFESPCGCCARGAGHFGPADVPTPFSLAYPAARREGKPPPFSLWRTATRSCRIGSETGGEPGTT